MSKKQYDVRIAVPPDLKLKVALRASVQLQAMGNAAKDAAEAFMKLRVEGLEPILKEAFGSKRAEDIRSEM